MLLYAGTIADGWALSEPLEDYNSLYKSEKARVDSARKSETYHKYYEAEAKIKILRRWTIRLRFR